MARRTRVHRDLAGSLRKSIDYLVEMSVDQLVRYLCDDGPRVSPAGNCRRARQMTCAPAALASCRAGRPPRRSAATNDYLRSAGSIPAW